MNRRLKFNNFIYLIIVFIILGGFSGCGSKAINTEKEAPTAGFSSITPEEAKKRLENEKGIILLDVRTKEEYDSGHINDAVLIPVDTLEVEAEKLIKDKDAAIFVYCRTGRRSTTAANILVKLGYKNIYNLGGIVDWPYEIVK
jgi:rhodanese-related sulfurtransferase